MRFWQKIFISVVVLFCICFGGAPIYMNIVSYNEMYENEKESAKTGAFFIRDGMDGSFAGLRRNNILGSDNKKRTFFSYGFLYSRKEIYLEYWEEGETLFTTFKGEHPEFDWSKAGDYERADMDGQILEFSKDGVDYFAIRQELYETDEDAALIYIYSLRKLQDSRKEQITAWIVAAVITCLVLAVILSIILKKMLKPLGNLTDAAVTVAEGNYGYQIPVQGTDELADLTRSFNEMSGKIREKLRELQQTDIEKQEFIDNLGHELRTPLTTVSGYAQYLLRAPANKEETIHSLEYIVEESNRLEKLSNTLLKLAVLKKDAIIKEKIPISRLMESAGDTFFFIFKEHGISFQCRQEPETERVYGNYELLLSLLTNLLENAVRACEDQGEIVLETDHFFEGAFDQCKEGMYEYTRFRISDNGIGMEEKELQQIMEPFYRVDKARSRKSGGVGLGMSLCRQVVECHGGKLEYESSPGRGTTVTAYIRNFQ